MAFEPIIVPGLGSKPEFEENVLKEAAGNKLVVGFGSMFHDMEMQLSWIKCMEMGWIRLFDIAMVLPNPALPPSQQNMPVPCRVFKLTNTGEERLREIRRKKEIDKRLKGTN